MTHEDILEGLGLSEPDIYEALMVSRNVEILPTRRGNPIRDRDLRQEILTRGTGRSTRTIVDALRAVSFDRYVCFQAKTSEQAKYLTGKARDFAVQLHLDPSLIEEPHTVVRRGIPISGNDEHCEVFVDHTFTRASY